LKCKIDNLKAQRLYTGEYEMSFTCKANDEVINELISKDILQIEIKPYREKRSLDANAYLWVLLGKIGEKLEADKEELYQGYVRAMGAYNITPIKETFLTKWIEIWSAKGLGWFCDTLGESKHKGYINVINYYGTSVYDTKEMSRVINEVVKDCESLGIDVKDPEEIEKLIKSWGES